MEDKQEAEFHPNSDDEEGEGEGNMKREKKACTSFLLFCFILTVFIQHTDDSSMKLGKKSKGEDEA